MRLDLFLVSSGETKSRTKASELISGGFVLVNGKSITKPSYNVNEERDKVTVTEKQRYVSRGGTKLDGALERFGIDVRGLVCADIGASTGGFTDCLLQRGAAHVYAIDAGHDQLDEKLKNDSRVTNIEGKNARELDADTTDEKCSFAVCDLSFISQTLVIPAVKNILTDKAQFVSLIKPQFECGREALGKNGVVKDKKQHIAAMRKVVLSLRENGFGIKSIMRSPIKGGDGNTEFLVYAVLGGEDCVTDKNLTEAADEKA